MNETLEDIISDSVHFRSPSSKGWRKVYCEYCGDGSRTKGPRGAWNLDSDTASYHCFNCGVSLRLEPPYIIGKKAKEILSSFNIPINKIIYLNNFLSKTDATPKKTKVYFNHIQEPDHFIKLCEAYSHPVYNLALDHLASKAIAISDYTFYLSSGKSADSVDENAKAKFMKNRLIIPAYHDNKMIYYQSRDLLGIGKKYVSVDKPRLGAMYFMDRLYDSNKFLYVTEGFYDAFHLKGVALMENHITNEQIELLNKCKKTKILVPDKSGTSDKMVDIGISHGWNICYPRYDDDVKDITDSVIKNGILYTSRLVVDSTMTAGEAYVNFQIMNK